jgi:hypothetical protein
LLLQAAYRELDQEQCGAVHLRIGRRLLEGLTRAQYDEHEFAILHHFNQALHLITEPAERLKLAQANLAAGERPTSRQGAVPQDKKGIRSLPRKVACQGLLLRDNRRLQRDGRPQREELKPPD